METRKIAVACFIGGALCSAVALMFAPVYWWFGLIAGMAGGYISYEFREVRKAIPIALRAAERGIMSMWTGTLRSIVRWFAKPHPVLYPSLAISAIFNAWMVYSYVHPLAEFFSKEGMETGLFWSYLLLLEVAMVVFFVTLGFVMLFVYIGARAGEHCYWWPFLWRKDELREKEELEAKGLRREPLSYRNIARWFTKGFGLAVLFLGWTGWKHLAIGVWTTFRFLGRFAWHLFKLIHSEKRVLCAIDGTLGGVMSYIWFASATMSFPEQALFVIFGGFIGAAFGVVNWEIVSKRILRVAPVNNA